MTHERIVRLVHDLAEHEVPATPNLWPAIQARITVRHPALGAGRRTAPERLAPMTRRLVSLRTVLAACLIAIVITGGLLLSVPPAQAAVWRTLQRFGIVLVAPTPVPSSPVAAPAAPAQAPTARETALARVSLAEAQQQVPFRIPLPTWLPDGVTLRGAFVGKGPSGDTRTAPISVTLSYQSLTDPRAGLGITIQNGPSTGGYVVPAGAGQEVLVNGHPAIFVQGAWTPERTWNETADATMLSWEADGFTYIVSSSGLGLTREDILRIAEPLR